MKSQSIDGFARCSFEQRCVAGLGQVLVKGRNQLPHAFPAVRVGEELGQARSDDFESDVDRDRCAW